MLRHELVIAFGRSNDLFREMKVKAIFKGLIYESLNDPDFMRIESRQIPSLHEEYDAAKAERQRDERKGHS